MYEPKLLQRWTCPSHYIGATWEGHYSSGFGQSRDSDCLERSNFRIALSALGGESDVVTVVRESHFLVGWVEWIAIKADGSADSNHALQIADGLQERVADYPTLDEKDFSELEDEEAKQTCEERRLQ